MNDSPVSVWLTSSQTRIFLDALPTESIKSLSALKNEPLSFFVAYRAMGGKRADGRDTDISLSIRLTSDTLPLSAYKILSASFPASECEDATVNTVGGCPDILLRRSPSPEIVENKGEIHLPFYEKDEKVLLCASATRTQALCVTVNEDGRTLPAGKHTVKLEALLMKTGETVCTNELTVELINATLPDDGFLYTNWLHYDCLADISGLPIWSDSYFVLLSKYIENAVRYGMNTLLLPAFTPALDTPVGSERMNVQLVGVKRTPDGFYFDLTLLRRFIELALDKGIKYFEHCHLFTQWGARTAISVYDTEGERIFGWNTSATDPEYSDFLNKYLNAFLELADSMGLGDRLLFHISDEPDTDQKEYYRQALNTVKHTLQGRRIGDALSDYSFYAEGIAELPVVRNIFADDFDGSCPSVMLYYTGGETEKGLANRLLTTAPERVRALGLHLYRYRASGFLHWGYNYYYGRMSAGLFDPATDPCFYKNIPGVTYLVYPDIKGSPLPSLRELYSRDAMNDRRALLLCERLIGREAVLKICKEELGSSLCITSVPKNGQAMIALRERINNEIRKAIIC